MSASQVKVLLFLAIGCLIGHGVAAVGDLLVPPTNFWRFERLGLRALSRPGALENVEVIGVGNSHAGAFDFPMLDLPGRTVLRAGGDILETSRSIRRWVPKMPKMRTVYFAASYFTFDVDNGALPMDRSNRIMYYAINPTLTPLRDDAANFAMGKLQIVFPHVQIVRGDAWQAPLLTALAGGPGYRNENSAEDPANINQEVDPATHPCASHDAAALEQMSVVRVAEYEDRVRAQRPALGDELYVEIVDLSEFLSSRAIRLVFVTPPYFERYNMEFEQSMPDVLDEFRENMQRLVSEEGVEYFDYGDDPRWSPDAQNFVDSDHLNECGKRSFLRALVEDTRPEIAGRAQRDRAASDRGADAW